MDLTNDDVADILALLDSLPYDSLDVQTPRFRLTLRRCAGGGWTSESQVFAEPTAVTPGTPAAAPAQTAPTAPTALTAPTAPTAPNRSGGSGSAPAAVAASASGQAADLADVDGLVPVATPLPGTFYRAPRPGAAPFVEVGDAVAVDTVVAIVETMKLMNSVHAGTAGRVARICLDNGDFAAIGATLILIEPEP
jgi:acetyl-CoA carboxylase biotin carboxyl carrier protein